MRQRLEILAAILAAGGAALALQQAMSVPGTLLPAGLYLTLAGAIILVVASLRPGKTKATWPARIVTIASVVIAVGIGLLAVAMCGPTVLVFDCRA